VAVDGHGRIWVSERHQTLKSTEDIALTLSLTPLFLEDNIDIISDAQGDGGGAWGPQWGGGAAASHGPRTRKGTVKVFDNDVLIEIPRQRVAGIYLTLNRGPHPSWVSPSRGRKRQRTEGTGGGSCYKNLDERTHHRAQRPSDTPPFCACSYTRTRTNALTRPHIWQTQVHRSSWQSMNQILLSLMKYSSRTPPAIQFWCWMLHRDTWARS
jgi:hypothetical protein